MTIRSVRRGAVGYPPLLAQIPDPPPVFWVRGDAPLDVLARPAVAVVGARACSGYGRSVARLLAGDAAAAGAVVVSGLARGIDGEAHRGALAAGGTTVAVLGCGVDRDYPAAHAELARAIVAAGGLMVSEYEPGVEPAPWRFPARNRIIAGLARATVVVEARERSGALITADFALEDGREVLAVPGEITCALSAGTNALLRVGATPATGVADVLEAVGLERRPKRRRPATDPAAHAVLDALGGGAGTADELGRATGLAAGALATALTLLELAGARRGRGRRGAQYDRAVTTPYWLDEPAHALPPGGDLTEHVDVGIVGAGVTGCACALALAEAGLRVRVVDARRVAEGASGRNGGFALRGTAAPYDEVVASFGRERALALWRWTEDELARDRAPCGRCVPTRRQPPARRRRRGARGSARRGRRPVGGRPRGRVGRRAHRAPSRDVSPRRSAIRPTACSSPPAGCGIWRRSPSRRARSSSRGSASPTRGAQGRDTVVVATDGYPSGLLGELEGLIVPTRGQVIATEPLDERLFEIPHYGRHGFDYWHQAEDGRLVAGGFRDVALDEEFTADERVTDDGAALARAVRERPRRARAAGRLPLGGDLRSRARLPARRRMFPAATATWVAGGYSGHGNVLGFACGRLVARAILGDRDPLLDLFEPARLLG